MIRREGKINVEEELLCLWVVGLVRQWWTLQTEHLDCLGVQGILGRRADLSSFIARQGFLFPHSTCG
jgi:hypothetical protein